MLSLYININLILLQRLITLYLKILINLHITNINVYCICLQPEVLVEELQMVEQIFTYFINNIVVTLIMMKMVAGVNLEAGNNYSQ